MPFSLFPPPPHLLTMPSSTHHPTRISRRLPSRTRGRRANQSGRCWLDLALSLYPWLLLRDIRASIQSDRSEAPLVVKSSAALVTDATPRRRGSNQKITTTGSASNKNNPDRRIRPTRFDHSLSPNLCNPCVCQAGLAPSSVPFASAPSEEPPCLLPPPLVSSASFAIETRTRRQQAGARPPIVTAHAEAAAGRGGFGKWQRAPWNRF